jgi:hypothetical protein
MKRALLLALALLCTPLSAVASPAERAVWTWEAASYAMLLDHAAADEAISFLHQKRIRTVYLYADAFDRQNLIVGRAAAYRQLIRRLHHEGFSAYALLGSGFLHTEAYVLPERRADAVAMFKRVLDYNAAAAADERFDGVNLDIEPHILEQWDRQKTQLLGQYLDLGEALMALKRSSGQSLQVGPALPFWFDGIMLDWHGVRQTVAEHTLGLYDYASLMDYRDHAEGRDGIVSHATDTMEFARRLHKKLVIGVEVTPNDIQKVSFDHLAEPDLERELGLTEDAFRDNEAFAGFAIHHFRGYQQWLERTRTATR